MMNLVKTILIGGAAGDGVKEAGINLARLLSSLGYYVFVSFEYPSLIRGGHNFCRISFSTEKIFNDHTTVDILLALNSETIELHKKELNKNALIISEKDLAMSVWAKEIGAPSIMRLSAALGALCKYWELPLKNLEHIFTEVFKEKAEKNIKLAQRGFDNFRPHVLDKLKIFKARPGEIVTDGNVALAEGLIKAGLNVYAAYPMTPASSIMHHLAKVGPTRRVTTVQPENELSVANLAIGSAYAGARTAVGTSGGGFALMEESFSLAGITETPFLAILSQRPGPATGVPTGTAQSDLNMARAAGHGEFPRIVLAPGDAEESYLLGGEALNLAWQFQTPVIVLLDKHLSESMVNVKLPQEKLKIKLGKIVKEVKGDYARYQFTADGISPMAFPGTQNAMIKANSYEHDEHGFSTEDLKLIVKMNDKRFKKMQGIKKAVAQLTPIKIYGDKKSKNVILFWGSTKCAALEALKENKKSIKAIQVLCVEPLPIDALKKELARAKKIIAVETNVTGQLADLVSEKCGVKINQKILRYDGRPFAVGDLVEKFKKI